MQTPTTTAALAELIKGCRVTADVIINGAVYSREIDSIDPEGNIIVRSDSGFTTPVGLEDIESIDAECADCGADYSADVDPADCELRFTGGHAAAECGGCGETITADSGDRHRRCHLIP